MNLLTKTNGILARIGSVVQSPVLLAIRLYWGWQFFVDGSGKFEHLDNVTKYFASLNIPMPRLNVMMAAGTQMACGLLLAAGLLSRFASIPLIGVMCVAYLTAESDSLHTIFSDPDKFVTRDPFLFLYAAVLVFVFGPGKLSLDALIFKAKKD